MIFYSWRDTVCHIFTFYFTFCHTSSRDAPTQTDSDLSPRITSACTLSVSKPQRVQGFSATFSPAWSSAWLQIKQIKQIILEPQSPDFPLKIFPTKPWDQLRFPCAIFACLGKVSAYYPGHGVPWGWGKRTVVRMGRVTFFCNTQRELIECGGIWETYTIIWSNIQNKPSQNPFSVADGCPDSSEAMAGESEEVIDARKTKMVPAKKSAPGSRREESTEFTGILPWFR